MKYQAINTYGGVEVYLFIYFKFTLRRFPSNSDYIESNERMKGEYELERKWKETVVA
jgi:hypothetical protein